MFAQLALALAVGSSPAEPHPVVGGSPAPGEEFSAVVRLEVPGIERFCSGTLIRPDVVLTAAHCLTPLWGPEDLTLVFDGSTRRYVEAAEIHVHPDYAGPDGGLDRFDFGYIRLTSPVDVQPLAVLTEQALWDETMAKGSEVMVVGYGEVPERTNGALDRWMVPARIRAFTETGFEFLAGGDGMDSCGGDSGGPALVAAADGTLWVAGVTSRGSKECGDGGFYGVAYHALPWLTDELDDVSLCGSSCGTCDCLDTTPLPEDGCCSTGRPDDLPWALLVLFILRRKKRPTNEKAPRD